MNDDFLLSAQDLLKRDDHKRLRLDDRIHIYGTEASFESGESNVEMVVTASEAAVTIYIYMEDVRLAASISSSSLQKAAVDGIWITVSVDDIHAYMEVTWTPPDNGGSNFAAIIKLKGPDREQKLSPDESESDDEEVGFGGQPADNITPPDSGDAKGPATTEQKAQAPKPELSPDESESEDKEVEFGGQLAENTAPRDNVDAKGLATTEQKAQAPKPELSSDENKCDDEEVGFGGQPAENTTPPDSGGAKGPATMKQTAPAPKPELFFDETQSQDEKAGSEKSYQIFVKRIDGKVDTYNVTTSLTVVELKQMIEQRNDLKPAEQRLLYESKQLEDNMTVGHYGIKHLSTVQLTMRMKGG